MKAATMRSIADRRPNNKSTKLEFELLANFLQRRLYTLAVKAAPRFPIGCWSTITDIKVLFDANYCPIWKKHGGDGVIEAADPNMWVTDIVKTEYFFEDDRLPMQQQLDGMERLRAVALRWKFGSLRAERRREWETI